MSPARNTSRPFTARSVVASTLLGMHPPELPAWVLVRSGELFGIADGTTRTALSRMVATGELVADDGRYRLAGARLLERQARQDAGRRPPVRRRWDGGWRTAVVTVEGGRTASARADLRATMTGARFAELREGVWLRPNNLAVDRPDDGGACTWLAAAPDGDDPAAMAARLWDLDGWAAVATRLRRDMAGLVDALEAGDVDALADGFVVSAGVLRHLQADPLLPAELLPDRWPGDGLRTDFDRYDAAFRRVWRAWYRSLRPSVG